MKTWEKIIFYIICMLVISVLRGIIQDLLGVVVTAPSTAARLAYYFVRDVSTIMMAGLLLWATGTHLS